MRFQLTKEDIADFHGADKPDEKLLKPMYDFIFKHSERLNNYRNRFESQDIGIRYEKYIFDIIADEIFDFDMNETLGIPPNKTLLELVCDQIEGGILEYEENR